MPWSLALLQSPIVVVTEYVGAMSMDEVREAALATIDFGRQHGVLRYLADCTGLAETAAPFELYDLIALYEALDVPRTMKEAVLLPAAEGSLPDMRFYETVSRNRGYDVRLYSDRERALAWLAT